MASTTNSVGEPISRDEPLHFLIHHIFLPPCPSTSIRANATNERELMRTVYDALRMFCASLDVPQSHVVDRCTQMLKCMMDAHNELNMGLNIKVLKQQMAGLRNNGSLAVYIPRHNSGLLLTRVGSEMRFEALSLLAPDDAVVGCEGRLRRHFPARAVVVGLHDSVRSGLLQPFTHVLGQLSPNRTRRNPDSGEPMDPKLVTDMLMGVLRGIGREPVGDEAVAIIKHSREEVRREVWSGTEFFWRRSPVWLFIRVVLQLTLDRTTRRRGNQQTSLYKAFMIFLMASVLDRAESEHVSHDLLFFMKAKISRRVVKLGAAGTEAASWYNLPRVVLLRTEMTLTKAWDMIQSPEAQALPLSQLAELDIDQDTVLSSTKLKEHLALTKQKKPAGETPGGASRALAARHLPFHRYRANDTLRPPFDAGNGETAYFELMDFESWVEAQIDRHMSLENQAERRAVDAAHHDIDASGTSEAKLGAPVHRPLGGGQAQDKQWQRSIDNQFAQDLWAKSGGKVLPHDRDLARQRRARFSQLCGECAELQIHDPHFERFISPGDLSEDCELCKMLHRVLWPRGAQSARLVRVFRQGTNLWTDRHSRPLLRLCVDPEWPLRDREIQVGLPQLSARSSPEYHELLRSWIQRCDYSHEDFGCAAASQAALPTRVIDVGANASEDERVVLLVCTNPPQRGRYVALSHCWGKPSEEEREANCTFTSTLTQRQQGINVAQLGKTFQDAIAITRALGERYLWIDSLCIIQDDRSDWIRESKCMEAVFSRAYCVIAATAATDAQAGFLRPPPADGFVVLPTPWGAPLYLCETVDDFPGDVEHAGLSRRGWVLQERALARRTIHFSSGQTYWECGRGIHCETLTLLNNQEAGFLGDPQFPTLAMGQAAATHTQHHVFQSVFKTYSRLELTRATDRQIAVAGVSHRLAEGMTSSVAFGVFTEFEYLHRSLLWRRAGHVFLHWIRNNTPKVPTWSWMAFMGPIDYVDITSTEIEWNPDIHLSITEETATITAPVTAFTARMLQTPDLLILDYRPRVDGEDLKCVVVGKQPSGNPDDDVYYVLVVLVAHSGGGGTGTEYERLGVATLRSSHLALNSGTERARII
ncbi:hypothetical protein OQA88_2048 [Cercophora sp. LCS_1]